MLTRIDSIPIADGCTFTDVKGRNFVAQSSMNLQSSALSAIVGLMIVQGGNIIAKSILKGQRSCSAAIPCSFEMFQSSQATAASAWGTQGKAPQSGWSNLSLTEVSGTIISKAT